MVAETGNTLLDQPLQTSVADAGAHLRLALAAMLDELSDSGVHEQRALQSALNLSQSATSRLVSSARATDPLATLARVPGSEGLRKMLRGAARAGVRRECLDQVKDAISRVEALIDSEIGDRYTLDAILSDWVHESRPSFELRQRAAAFKAMSALRGIQTDASVACWILHPSSDPSTYDAVHLDAVIGCRRVRPNAIFHATSRHFSFDKGDSAIHRLDGRPIEHPEDALLKQYTSMGSAAMEIVRSGAALQTFIKNLPIGKGRGANIVSAAFYRGLHRAGRAVLEERSHIIQTSGVAAHAEPPTQDFVLDVLLHEDVWPDVQPELRVFDTVVRGLAHPDDAARQADRLEVPERMVFLGKGIHAFRVVELAEYTEMIAHICEQRNWDGTKLRGYRIKMRYPIYGSQVCLAFPLRERSTAP